jgi:hypothetical protein
MIYYRAETLQQFVQNKAKNVAAEEPAEIEDSDEIAKLHAELGAPQLTTSQQLQT